MKCCNWDGGVLVVGIFFDRPREKPLPYFLRDTNGVYTTDLFAEELALVLMKMKARR
jgi:hypothetical protein